MSGLFCADPIFLYRSPNDKFLLEVYEGGQVVILDLDRGTSTAFENMIQLDELKTILLLASNDQHERKRKSSWSSSDVVEDHIVQECPRCNIYNSFDDEPDDPVNDLFRCNNCNELVHISSIILIHPDDLDDIPF